jgi:hypothetical protein
LLRPSADQAALDDQPISSNLRPLRLVVRAGSGIRSGPVPLTGYNLLDFD